MKKNNVDPHSFLSFVHDIDISWLPKDHLLKEELIRPTNIYVKELSNLNEKSLINGCANITGGGLVDNIKRIIPQKLGAEIYLNRIKTLKILFLETNNRHIFSTSRT